MKGQKPATDTDKRRFGVLAAHGCMLCRKLGLFQQAEIHHLVEGMTRLGHRWTIPLCDYHHRGVIPFGMGKYEARKIYRSSLAHSKRSFVADWGTERQLLAEIDARFGWKKKAEGQASEDNAECLHPVRTAVVDS